MKKLYTRGEAQPLLSQTIWFLAGSRRAAKIKEDCESLLHCFWMRDYSDAYRALSNDAVNEYFRCFADIAEWAGLETREKMRDAEIGEKNSRAAGDDRYVNARSSLANYPDVPTFYRNLAASTPPFKAVGEDTKCGLFVYTMLLKQFGEPAQKKIFPDGLKSANVMFEKFKENKYLEKIETTSMKKIQDMADRGIMILISCKNDKGPGHMAFVGHSDLTIHTIPETPLQGQVIGERGEEWWPVVVQAGTFTGVTSMVYATNEWTRKRDELLGNSIHFYAIKKEAL